MGSTDEELLRNAGKAIERLRKLKKISKQELSKKSKINISIIRDICSGKVSPTQEEMKLICKAMDISKEMIMMYSITENDVAPEKRDLFNKLLTPMKVFMEDEIRKDTKKKIKNKSKKSKTKKK